MLDQRPYATLLAKGEDRRQRILAVAQRLLTRNGWRSTTLGQIAKEAGVSTAGLLHHFESKDQLLKAVLDARDERDQATFDMDGDLVAEIERRAARFETAPDLIGTFVILLIENLDPEAPLRERIRGRSRNARTIIAAAIRRGQREGRYRADIDPDVKALEIIAFFNGMETSWLLDPSIPVAPLLKEYATSLAQRLALSTSTS